jgi:disulfide bond formation protein DsbB
MPAYAQTLTYIFALGMVGMHVVLIASALHRIVTGVWVPAQVYPYVRRFGLGVAAVLAVAALLLSLWYSEIVGLPVCVLCWLTRTMMYPLAIMLPIAAWRGDRALWPYILSLSMIGGVISGYQHLMQMGVVAGGFCHALSGNTDCAARYVYEFGYITMPMYGLTVFAAIALLAWLARR